jgi:hypothetical protein
MSTSAAPGREIFRARDPCQVRDIFKTETTQIPEEGVGAVQSAKINVRQPVAVHIADGDT